MKPIRDEAYYREFIQARVKIDENGCWLWQKFKKKPPCDYGFAYAFGKNWGVHRLAYKLWIGPLDPALDVCHTCDVKYCCNPAHLWQGTPKENMQDAAKKKIWSRQHQTHCKSGHEFTPENTYRSPASPNKRRCRECDRSKNKNPAYIVWRTEYQRRKRAEKRSATV